MSEPFKVTLFGREAFFAALAGLDARAADLRPSWPKVGEIYERAVSENFASEGGRAGGWEGLSEAYAARKAKTHPGKPIEQKDGKLLASLIDKTAEGAIVEEGPDTYARGSSLPYARRQHEGYGSQPARDLFGLRDEDGEEMLRAVADDLTAYARDLGFKA
jgi:phage gpG-like protein